MFSSIARQRKRKSSSPPIGSAMEYMELKDLVFERLEMFDRKYLKVLKKKLLNLEVEESDMDSTSMDMESLDGFSHSSDYAAASDNLVHLSEDELDLSEEENLFKDIDDFEAISPNFGASDPSSRYSNSAISPKGIA